MKPYYQDDLVTLYHADCLENISKVQGGVDALVTDPPYFKVKEDEWDNQWNKSSDFLAWMGGWVDEVKPILAPHASVWVFASPAMTSSVERLIGERFKVLNSIRWVKEAGWHQKIKLEAQRRFTTPWEGVIFAEQYHDVYSDQYKALRKEVFAPLGRYIQTERELAGWSSNDVDVELGYVRTKNPQRGTELCRRWEEGSSLPSAGDYKRLRDALNRMGGDYLRREYEELRREYEELRRPFHISERVNNSDVWTFDPVQGYPGKHPCEKPIEMMEHIIKTSTREGHTVLDPFAGSGSTLRAAKSLGRRAIGFEIEEKYCAMTAKRLAQDDLFVT